MRLERNARVLIRRVDSPYPDLTGRVTAHQDTAFVVLLDELDSRDLARVTFECPLYAS